MAYDSTVPATGHSGSQDYTAMRGNFLQIQTSFSVDHEPLAVGGGIEGFHKKSSYVQSGSDPAPAANLGIVYTKLAGSHTELFYEGESGTGKVLQITNQSLAVVSGQGMMPGGLQIRSGQSTTGTPVSFVPSFGTSVISVVATAFANNNVLNIINPTTGGFTAVSPGGAGLAYFWIATGY